MNREFECFPYLPVHALEFGVARQVILHTQSEFDADSRVLPLPLAFWDGVHPRRQLPSDQSQVYRVTQILTDGIHRQGSASTGSIVTTVVLRGSSSTGCCLFRQRHIMEYWYSEQVRYKRFGTDWGRTSIRQADTAIISTIIIKQLSTRMFRFIFPSIKIIAFRKSMGHVKLLIRVFTKHEYMALFVNSLLVAVNFKFITTGGFLDLPGKSCSINLPLSIC